MRRLIQRTAAAVVAAHGGHCLYTVCRAATTVLLLVDARFPNDQYVFCIPLVFVLVQFLACVVTGVVSLSAGAEDVWRRCSSSSVVFATTAALVYAYTSYIAKSRSSEPRKRQAATLPSRALGISLMGMRGIWVKDGLTETVLALG